MRLTLASIALLSLILSGCASTPFTGPTKFPQVHAHRGSRGTHPENTLPAFEEGWKSGADFIELDLHLTAENIPLVTHDPVISDLCLDEKGNKITTPIPVKTTPLKELKKLDCGSTGNPRFSEQLKIPGTKMPTFEEFLVWFTKHVPKKIQLNVETKLDPPDAKLMPDPEVFTKAVLKLLKKYGVTSRTVLQSFDFRTLDIAKKLNPKLRLSALYEKKADFCAEAQKAGYQIVSVGYDLMSEDVVKDCHARGIQVHPWTLNKISEQEEAMRWGVDGIITDYPRNLVEKLRPFRK